ncbi:GNAT family N-acetyltransferase [Streptomyces sp. NBC_01571]|uniref:GNAT family N-acetyltransferase n=1 Tax=Streptomyces sp. NBC_01571 TaxID=2975883 RepID=UPI00225BD5C5|nr:GNAT family N-acetyltransferase [Streptomyces sp. NBC_01571]MCX4573532.1 GNAT family N-acetyltransferase [Streptomyces sp. NBC_01571]
MQSTTIKRAVAQDADRPTGLVQDSGAYRGPYASIIPGYRVTADYIARHQVFVAIDEVGRLQGFYALVLESPELDLAFVADDVQGRGVGRLLIEHMLGQARAAGLRGVGVVSHPPAVAFYRRLGAVRVGTVAPAPPKVDWERPDLRFTPA